MKTYRKTRSPWFAVFVALLAWSVSCGPGSAPEGGEPGGLEAEADDLTRRPNFIVILADDMRYDALGIVQREQGDRARFPWFRNGTPNLDALATHASSCRFSNAFVVNSLCSPSRAAFLTGQYNHLNGVANNHSPFPITNVTYATQLRDAGYQTGYFGKWHMGFQHARPGFNRYATFEGQGAVYDQSFFFSEGSSERPGGWTDDATTTYALRFLESAHDVPFLAVIGFKSPHTPRVPPQRTATLYSKAVIRPPESADALAPWETSKDPFDPEDIRNYFRMITAIDDNVGRVLQKLTELRIARRTLIVFASDNGYFLGEHGRGDKRQAYEEAMRVPFIVRYPRVPVATQANPAFVLNIDLAPTFLAAAGVAIPPAVQGQSLLPLMGGEVTDLREGVFYEYFWEVGYEVPTQVAWRGRNHKIIQYPKRPAIEELYDLVQDPLEMDNVVATNLAQRDKLRAELQTAKARFDFRIPRYADGF